MGWFSDLWDGIKSTASNVWSGVKSVAGKVYDTVRKPVDFIAGLGNVVSKIPVIGTLAQPIIGAAKGAQSLLDQGKAVSDITRSIGLQNGGIVQKKYYQA
jgi:phage-related protein